mmetsp:Transcript_4214/g.10127  ORF Transcript_4214/g.10127 Transcript_4214/m.10127 type:complete len:213 (-) Transcript_4214:945-1583(-)
MEAPTPTTWSRACLAEVMSSWWSRIAAIPFRIAWKRYTSSLGFVFGTRKLATQCPTASARSPFAILTAGSVGAEGGKSCMEGSALRHQSAGSGKTTRGNIAALAARILAYMDLEEFARRRAPLGSMRVRCVTKRRRSGRAEMGVRVRKSTVHLVAGAARRREAPPSPREGIRDLRARPLGAQQWPHPPSRTPSCTARSYRTLLRPCSWGSGL